MNRLLRKSTLVSVFTAGLVVLLSACGGGGSSSGGGGAATGGTTMVRGNVSGVGGGRAMLMDQMPGSAVVLVVKLIADGLISSAYANHGTQDVLVCIEVDGNAGTPFCAITDEHGDFSIILPAGVGANTYPITFTTINGVTYTADIEVVAGAVVEAKVNIDEENREVAITERSDDIVGITDPEPETAGNSDNVLVTICHKPDTPAEKTKTLPEPAIPAHIAHGDRLGACS